LGILAILLAVGAVGHQTHWTFYLGGHDEAHADHKDSAPEVESTEAVTTGKIDVGPTGEWEVKFPSENSLELSGIVTAPIEQKNVFERIRTPGVITYNELLQASLSARTTGTIWQVCKHVGETIRKGDVLVIVDAADVGQCKAEFLSALVAREAKTEILTNLESISEGAIPLRQVREARVALREARIRLLNAEQTLVNLGFSIKAEEYEQLGDAQRAEKIQFLGLPESLVKDLDRTKTTSNLLPLRATFDGVVVKQGVALGETAEQGKPLLEIADLRRMWLMLNVPKEEASKLALGQSVTFNPDGIDHHLQASITWISTEVDEQTRTLQVRAEVENPCVSTDSSTGNEVRLLRANTFGTGTIVLRSSQAAMVVPTSAVIHDDRQPLVFIRTGELSFQRADVTLGIRDGAMIELKSSDLKPGTEVVIRGGHVLKSEYVLNHVASASP
jgi:multidrug efflux pump subunit AcrA (membrane-fusion protein)